MTQIRRGSFYASSSRTRGATFVPMSSMLVISLSWGSVPALYLIVNRDSPSACHRSGNLDGDGFRGADAQRAIGTGFALELHAASPAATRVRRRCG